MKFWQILKCYINCIRRYKLGIFLKKYCTIKSWRMFIMLGALIFIPMLTFAEPIRNNSITNSSEQQSATNINNQSSIQADLIPAEPLLPMENSNEPYLVVKLKYIKAEQAKTMFAALMPNNQIKVEAMNNMLIVIANQEDLKMVKAILAKIDKAPQQVMFEAQIIELSLMDLKKIGIDWGQNTMLPDSASMTEGKDFRVKIGTKYGVNFRATVNHLLQNKKGRLLANPRIAVLDGCTAQIMIGDKLAVESVQNAGSDYSYKTVNYIDVGIKLEVTPTVHENGTITTCIKPEVSNKTDATPSGNPNIRSRQAETTLRVKNGETIVLGGLIQREEGKDIVKFPLLGDIPLLGHFFRSVNKEKKETELVILITPKILD